MHAVGKIRDLFAGRGDHREARGRTNAKGIASTTRLLEELDAGLIFVNLVETDQVYGHRHDVEGFHEALKEIDAAVAGWLELLRDDDLLVLTADHGVDPNVGHTDHTREYAPLLARFAGPSAGATATAAATTARSPTWAPACCAGSTARGSGHARRAVDGARTTSTEGARSGVASTCASAGAEEVAIGAETACSDRPLSAVVGRLPAPPP